MSRVYNFSAGPAVLPEEVLKEVAAEMMDCNGTGMSVLEMSHRSPAFQAIIDEAEKDLRELMNIPDNYRVLFLQGGLTVSPAGGDHICAATPAGFVWQFLFSCGNAESSPSRNKNK